MRVDIRKLTFGHRLTATKCPLMQVRLSTSGVSLSSVTQEINQKPQGVSTALATDVVVTWNGNSRNCNVISTSATAALMCLKQLTMAPKNSAVKASRPEWLREAKILASAS